MSKTPRPSEERKHVAGHSVGLSTAKFSAKGQLGTHSIRKLAFTPAREEGMPGDDLDCRA